MLQQDEARRLRDRHGRRALGAGVRRRSRSRTSGSTATSTSQSIPQFLRPAEVDHLVGDASKARRELGWEPQVSFEELVEMMVDADLERLSVEAASPTSSG